MKRALLLFVTLLAACGKPTAATQPDSPPTPAVLEADGQKYRITGPYAHENLAVYLLHSDTRDDRDFITLDEGLKSGKVTVTEKDADGQVSELQLENAGDVALFIQEGDRVKGGKQDRIVGLSFVVPAKSGKQPIPSFCIEQGRWSYGGNDSRGFTVASKPLAPKEVRAAAKAGKDQSEVWERIGLTKRAAEAALGSENTNSSLNETMDSEKTKKAVEPFQKNLEGILAGRPDAVGVAFALNGRIEEVNIYPGGKLLAKLYPRLLESYALSAILAKKGGTPPAPAEVATFMKEGGQKSKRTEKVAENTVTIVGFEQNVQCLTDYQGKRVHSQWMCRDETPAPSPANEQRQQRER